MYVYIAGPLFSNAERWFNAEVKHCLTQLDIDSFLPQQDGLLVEQMIDEGRLPSEVFDDVYKLDIQKLNECTILLAVLDGAVIDEGTAFEIGYATALGRPCYGIQTDSRRQLPSGNNPMIENSLLNISKSIYELQNLFQKLVDESAET